MKQARAVGVYIESNFWSGAAIYIFAFGIITLFMIPSGFLTIMGGIVFRPIYFSVVFALLGSQVGILLSLGIGKTLLRPYVISLFEKNKRVSAVDKAIKKEGFKVVALLRMTPVFPFGFCNYFLSGTGLDLKTIVLGSLVGNLPGCIINSVIGSMIGDLTRENTETPVRMQALTWLFSVVFTIAAIVFIGILSKKSFRDIVDLEKIEDQESLVDPTSSTPLNSSNQVQHLQANSLLLNLEKINEAYQFNPSLTLRNQPIVVSIKKLEASTTTKSEFIGINTPLKLTDNHIVSNNIKPSLADVPNSQVKACENDDMLSRGIPIEILEPTSKGYTKNEKLIMNVVGVVLLLSLAIGIPIILVLTPNPNPLK